MKFLTDKELESQLDLLNANRGNRDSILIRLALYTGARGVEILRITPADLREGSVFITAAKGSNNRLLPLPSDFFRELVVYVDSQGIESDKPIFPISTRHFRRIWDYWRVSPDKGAHCLRHTIGVRHYTNSTDIHATKTLMGHKNIQNTMRYLDYVEGQRKLKATMKGLFTMKKKAA